MKESFFEYGGTKMYYTIRGTGHPLLFLHGMQLSTKSYGRVIEYLSKHFRVIAPDLPPFGKSSLPKRVWGYKSYVRFLTKFLEHLKLKRKVIVAGHSFGGGLALHLGERSRFVKKVIAADPVAFPLTKRIERKYHATFWWRVIRALLTPRYFKTLWRMGNEAVGLRIHDVGAMAHVERIVRKCFFLSPILRSPYRSQVTLIWNYPEEFFPKSWPLRLKKIIGKKLKIVRVKGDHDWLLFKPRESVALIKKHA